MHHYGPEAGQLSDALTSPDNVTFRIVEVQRGAGRWLFHVHAHNNAGRGVPILDAAHADHYFVLGGKGTPGVPYTWSQITLTLTPPGPADAATYPALPASLASHADGDGWLVADLTQFKLPPIELLYVYGTVQGTACASLTDPSTCHPDVGYRTLLWRL